MYEYFDYVFFNVATFFKVQYVDIFFSRISFQCPAVMQLAKRQPLPEFDVKIVASRRIVIWKDPKETEKQADKAKSIQSSNPPLPLTAPAQLNPKHDARSPCEDLSELADSPDGELSLQSINSDDNQLLEGENSPSFEKDHYQKSGEPLTPENAQTPSTHDPLALPPIDRRHASQAAATSSDPTPPQITENRKQQTLYQYRQTSFDEKPLPALQNKARKDYLQVPSNTPEEGGSTLSLMDAHQDIQDVGATLQFMGADENEMPIELFKTQNAVSKESDESSNDRQMVPGKTPKYLKKDMQPVGVIAASVEIDKGKFSPFMRRTASRALRKKQRYKLDSRRQSVRPKSFSVLEPIGVDVAGNLVYPRRKKSPLTTRILDAAQW